MYFTNSEKQAIHYLLMRMSLIDNDVDTKEVLLSSLICGKLNISKSDIENSMLMSVDEAIRIVSNMTASEKDFVCAALGAMIAIDGEIKPKEMLLWGLISNQCGFPEMNLMQAEVKLQQYL